MDILKRLYENQISEKEAEKIVDEMIERFHAGKLKNSIEEFFIWTPMNILHGCMVLL